MSNRKVLLAAFVIAGATSTATFATTFGPAVSQGTVTAPAIVEGSGLAASHNNSNILWTENDSGNTNQIFAIDTAGVLRGTYTLSGSTNSDWEDIAIGPGPVAGVSYIYLMESNSGGDPGRVYRVPEPVVYSNQSAVTKSITGVESKKFTFTAPDSEGMIVDPTDGGIYIFSKDTPTAKVFHGTQAQFATAGTTSIDPSVATLNPALSKANGADISPNGSEILVRNQGQFAELFHRAPGQSVASAVSSSTPDFVTVNGKDVEPNAESIAFDASGKDFYTFSEGTSQKLYKYSRTSNDAPFAPTTLVSSGSSWKYRDDGSNQGTAWRANGFDDSTGWSTGTAQLGYGDGDETTTVGFGGNASNKFITTYFRKTFTVADTSSIQGLTLKLLYDDGAAVYLNGTEIARTNLIAGAAFNTLATATPDSLENTWTAFTVNPALLINGTNTLSIEIHQTSATDSDISFDAQLVTALPEPTAALLLGGLPLVSRRRRTR